MRAFAKSGRQTNEVHEAGRISAQRLVSLDVFRGATIAGMLLVNNPGSWSHIYPPLRHAAWHGWTPTDLIFPFFLFIVGTAITLSFERLLQQGMTRGEVVRKSAVRAVLIFLAGILLHSFPWWGVDYSQLRIPGVLQRIAIAYFMASLIYLYAPTLRARVVAIAVLLFGYWAAQTLIPVPGGYTGVLQPGLDLGSYIDRMVFTERHLWEYARTWDPEGLLSTIPAIGTVLLGALAGTWLRSERPALERALGLFIAGAVAMVAGAAWGWVFPINKSLWTSSYTVFTAGMACQVLAFCYWLVDIQGKRRWVVPFIVFGTNALAAFFLSSLLARVLIMVTTGPDQIALKTLIYRNLFLSWASPVNASLAFAITYVLFWVAVMAVLYKKRIFIKL